MGTVVVKALKDLHGPSSVTKAGEQIEMDETPAKFHKERGNVEIVKTKERKFRNASDEAN